MNKLSTQAVFLNSFTAENSLSQSKVNVDKSKTITFAKKKLYN